MDDGRTWTQRSLRWTATCGVLLTAAFGCTTTAEPVDRPDFSEAWSQGVADYVGLATVSSSVTAGDVTTYEFATASGPKCLRGDPFRMSIRAKPSDDLLIFLQGGGACWSKFCLAIQKAPSGIPNLDVLDPSRADNPWKDWNVAYLPYCDGSMFAGEADWDDDGDGKLDRQQHGLRNLTAGLDVAVKQSPHPKHIALVGSSGGGFGTIPAVLLVRKLWPDAEILVVQDSGTGTGKPNDPAFLATLISEFKVQKFFPASCTACVNASHLTPLLDWEMARDSKLRVAAFSSYEDSIMAAVFMKIPPADFRSGLLEATGLLHTAYPDRYKRFFTKGSMHTTMLGDASGIIGSDMTAVTLPTESLADLAQIVLGNIQDTQIGGVTMATWLAAARDNSAEWVERLE